MTKEEIQAFLAGTKVYVNGKSKEIQERLFSLGCKWRDGDTEVCYTEQPFLYIHHKMFIVTGADMENFSKHENREITAEEILSIEVTDASYRPFKYKEECWQEMHKHPDFGWIICDKKYHSVCDVTPDEITILYECDPCCFDFKSCMGKLTFTDGTPFGIKEE